MKLNKKQQAALRIVLRGQPNAPIIICNKIYCRICGESQKQLFFIKHKKNCNYKTYTEAVTELMKLEPRLTKT